MASDELNLASPATWGEEPDKLELHPVPMERIRPHFVNRRLFRTRGPRQALRSECRRRVSLEEEHHAVVVSFVVLALGRPPENLIYHT